MKESRSYFGRRIRVPLLGLLVVGAGTFIAGALIMGSRLAAPAPAAVGEPPAHLGKAEAVHIPSESGSRLAAWFVPGTPGRGAVLLLHGIGGSRLGMVGRAAFLSRSEYSVLLVDLQAHGESPGKMITFGYLESHDVEASVSYLKERMPEERIGIIGVSLGGAAVLLARKALGVDAVVLESVYPTIEDAVRNRVRNTVLSPLTWLLAPALLVQVKPRLGFSVSDLRPIDRIEALGAPVLVVAGMEDRHTLFKESESMFARARDPREFWGIPGAAHVDFFRHDRSAYEERILRFLRRYLNGASQGR